jgi:hypothetical protein
MYSAVSSKLQLPTIKGVVPLYQEANGLYLANINASNGCV